MDTDQYLLEIGERVSEFGGVYVDERGTLHLWLTRPDEEVATKAQAALVATFDDDELAVDDVEIVHADYSFTQLKRWHDQLGDLVTLPGVVFDGIDHRTNRLVIAVEDASTLTPTIEAGLEQRQIPVEAVNIITSGPVLVAPDDGRDLRLPIVLMSLVALAGLVVTLRRRRARARVIAHTPTG